MNMGVGYYFPPFVLALALFFTVWQATALKKEAQNWAWNGGIVFFTAVNIVRVGRLKVEMNCYATIVWQNYKCQRLRASVDTISQIKMDMDDREYNQLDSLASSNNTEVSRLSVIVKNLKERLESLEKNQTDLMDKLNDLKKEKDTRDEDDGDDSD